VLMARDEEASVLESLRNGLWRGDVVILDPLEPDCAEAELHSFVDRRHPEQEVATWLQNPADFVERARVLVQVLEPEKHTTRSKCSTG